MPKMAKTALFFFSFSLVFSSVFSRTLPPSSKTNVLDISSSIQKTLDVFSVSSQANNSLESQGYTSSSLSLELHSRVGLRKTSHADYKSLTLARLGRDVARVNSLQTRLDLAVHGTSDTQFDAEALGGPVISGRSHGSGEYFGRVGIGLPPSQVYMVLDTGSDVNWVQCAACDNCYQQADPIYQPASSASFSRLACETQQCRSLDVRGCNSGTCRYEVHYGDGSYTIGDFVTETIAFGGSDSVNDIAMGCGHDNEGLFFGAGGLIGLGGGPLSFPSQINAKSFSYCLVDRDSSASSTLDFDSVIPTDAVSTPLLRNPRLDTFYYVDLTGISVAGELVSIPPSIFKLNEFGEGGVIIDSGTVVTRLQTEAYNAVRDAFVEGTQNWPPANGVALFDTCYDLGARNTVECPTVSFHFSNGEELALPAENCLIPVDSTGTFCFAFAPTSSSLNIFGNVQQQGTRVSYDLANSEIAFSSNNC